MEQPVIFETTLNASPSKVWKAITNKDEMQQWYFNITEFKPEPGFEFQFSAGPAGEQYLHVCKITEVIPEKKLGYSWRYDGYEGTSFVSFELFPEGDITRLKLTHTALETFPDLPQFSKKNFAEGWKHIIGTSLKNFVES